MPKIYCQNDLCKYCNKVKSDLSNYGICTKREVFMTWQADDEYEVTGFNAECLHSQQRRSE